MKNVYLLAFSLLFFFLTGCTEEITEEDIIGGNWIATSGFQDGDAGGEPSCYPFQEGIKFKDESIVYNETFERDFEYWFGEDSKIIFNDEERILYSYQITMISEDELVLEGINTREGHSCYMERN